jgi:hypothetical protein
VSSSGFTDRCEDHQCQTLDSGLPSSVRAQLCVQRVQRVQRVQLVLSWMDSFYSCAIPNASEGQTSNNQKDKQSSEEHLRLIQDVEYDAIQLLVCHLAVTQPETLGSWLTHTAVASCPALALAWRHTFWTK